MNTELLYMKNMAMTECQANVVDLKQYEGKDALVLDQTVFYPQGGGQPYDTGAIKSLDESFLFEVNEVRFLDGLVYHIGKIKNGTYKEAMVVVCKINQERRTLNARLHSAGHLVDLALKELNINWVPGKGYHFPDGAYVEYSGNFENVDLEEYRLKIENKCNELIRQNIKTTITFDESKTFKGKPMRTVYYGDFGIACGGTHVLNLKEIMSVRIRKVKKEKDKIRVSYEV